MGLFLRYLLINSETILYETAQRQWCFKQASSENVTKNDGTEKLHKNVLKCFLVSEYFF